MVPDGAVPPEGEVPQSEDVLDSSTQSPLKGQGVEAEVTEGEAKCPEICLG